MVVPEISAEELKRRLEAGETLRVLDVREPWEFALARLDNSLNIPLGDVSRRLPELDPDAETVVMCKSGGRSRRAAQFLLEHGFGKVWNLSGGIDAWSEDIQPDLPRY